MADDSKKELQGLLDSFNSLSEDEQKKAQIRIDSLRANLPSPQTLQASQPADDTPAADEKEPQGFKKRWQWVREHAKPKSIVIILFLYAAAIIGLSYAMGRDLFSLSSPSLIIFHIFLPLMSFIGLALVAFMVSLASPYIKRAYAWVKDNKDNIVEPLYDWIVAKMTRLDIYTKSRILTVLLILLPLAFIASSIAIFAQLGPSALLGVALITASLTIITLAIVAIRRIEDKRLRAVVASIGILFSLTVASLFGTNILNILASTATGQAFFNFVTGSPLAFGGILTLGLLTSVISILVDLRKHEGNQNPSRVTPLLFAGIAFLYLAGAALAIYLKFGTGIAVGSAGIMVGIGFAVVLVSVAIGWIAMKLVGETLQQQPGSPSGKYPSSPGLAGLGLLSIIGVIVAAAFFIVRESGPIGSFFTALADNLGLPALITTAALSVVGMGIMVYLLAREEPVIDPNAVKVLTEPGGFDPTSARDPLNLIRHENDRHLGPRVAPKVAVMTDAELEAELKAQLATHRSQAEAELKAQLATHRSQAEAAAVVGMMAPRQPLSAADISATLTIPNNGNDGGGREPATLGVSDPDAPAF